MAVGSVDIQFRLRASGTDNSTSNYKTGRIYIGSSDNLALANTNNQSTTYFNAFQAGTKNNGAIVDIYSPNLATETLVTYHASSPLMVIGGGLFDATTTFDSLTWIAASSTLSGTYSLYGYNI